MTSPLSLSLAAVTMPCNICCVSQLTKETSMWIILGQLVFFSLTVSYIGQGESIMLDMADHNHRFTDFFELTFWKAEVKISTSSKIYCSKNGAHKSTCSIKIYFCNSTKSFQKDLMSCSLWDLLDFPKFQCRRSLPTQNGVLQVGNKYKQSHRYTNLFKTS